MLACCSGKPDNMKQTLLTPKIGTPLYYGVHELLWILYVSEEEFPDYPVYFGQ